MLKKKHIIPSLEDIKALRAKIIHTHKVHQEGLAEIERLAVWVTNQIGTMGFFAIVLVWTVLWLMWNTVGPKDLRFDPAPTFLFWLFISNLIQLLIMPLIMIGQNLQNRHSEIRAESEYNLEIKIEKEMEHVLQHLENMEVMLHDLHDRIFPQDNVANGAKRPLMVEREVEKRQ